MMVLWILLALPFPLKVRHSIKTVSSSSGPEACVISACHSSALPSYPQGHKRRGGNILFLQILIEHEIYWEKM